jgi:Tfp pilus assembly protein PilN
MSAKLNLASKPFRNRALPWTVTALITVLAFLALVWIAQSTFRTRAQVAAIERENAGLQRDVDLLNRKEKEVESALTDEQKKDLKYAHGLVDRKAFSWARLFADLEGALPGGVRVTRIAVKEVRMQGGRAVADLELVVASKTYTTVTDMIQEMQSRGIFTAVLVAQNPQRARGETGSEYELSVHYEPTPGFAIERAEEKPPVDTVKEGGKSR